MILYREMGCAARAANTIASSRTSAMSQSASPPALPDQTIFVGTRHAVSCFCRLTNNISSNGFAPFLYRHRKPCPPKNLNSFCRGIALLCPAFPAQPDPSFRRYTMSRRYSPEQKKDFIDRLIANGGDVQLTSAETGVPMRTLITWRQ